MVIWEVEQLLSGGNDKVQGERRSNMQMKQRQTNLVIQVEYCAVAVPPYPVGKGLATSKLKIGYVWETPPEIFG